MSQTLCKCGESYAQADLNAVIDHALCDWPEPALEHTTEPDAYVAETPVYGTLTTSIPRAFAHLSELRRRTSCKHQR